MEREFPKHKAHGCGRRGRAKTRAKRRETAGCSTLRGRRGGAISEGAEPLSLKAAWLASDEDQSGLGSWTVQMLAYL